MELIRNWATVVCITLVVTILFSMLVPKGSMERVLQFSISLFFIVSFITPFITQFSSFRLDVSASAQVEESNLESVSALEESFEQKLLELTKENLEEKGKGFLEEIGVRCQKISVSINKEEDDSITISKITVWLDNAYQSRQAEIEEKLTEEMMARPELIFS